MSNRLYTGIGSRETPREAVALLQAIGYELAKAGYVLRSGAANGADSAFEHGADRARGTRESEIYLPWHGFNGHASRRSLITPAAYAMAESVHPAWGVFGIGPRKLHARNCYQVLGPNLDAPSDLLICWTPDGCESEKARTRKTGGTATAIVLAERNGVPVFNVRHDAARVRLTEFLMERGVVVEIPLQEVVEAMSQPGLF